MINACQDEHQFSEVLPKYINGNLYNYITTTH